MRKNYRKAPPQKKVWDYRTNERILAQEVRLIDENDAHVGVLPIGHARARAEAAELDLIEIEPKASPPVCKIMDFGKLKYSLEKGYKKQKAKQKKIEVKGVRLSLRIGQHDLHIRREQALSFLEQSDKVRLEMVLRGRERAHADLARDIMMQFIDSLKAAGGKHIFIESPLSSQGGRINMIIGSKT